jgi:alkanesulfonate monooxygenase SsuD/methylene tetrahydromethanopterin reductase-like flavin-dependent oxidoreductase (luciferase family)
MRVNWMFRNSPPMDYDQLIDFTEELDSVGYHSVLLTVHSRKADYLPLVAAIMRRDYAIKYMLAVRPYLLSPQYFTMLMAGMQNIAKDKLIINWVHGVMYPEETFDAVLNVTDDMYEPSVRRDHMRNFLNALKETDMMSPIELPESIISGATDEIMEMAKEFGLHFGTGYDLFLKEHEKIKSYGFDKVFLQTGIIVRETDEEAFRVRKEKFPDINVIYGSPETVKKELLRLHHLGATDFFVSNVFHGGKEERLRIHELISSMKKDGLVK